MYFFKYFSRKKSITSLKYVCTEAIGFIQANLRKLKITRYITA